MSCLMNVGLSEKMIDEAYLQCEELLEALCIEDEVDSLDEMWLEKLKEDNIFAYDEPDVTCIEFLFEITEKLIHENYPNLGVDYFAQTNLITSEVDDEIQKLRECHVNKGIIKVILENELYNLFMFSDLLELCANDYVIFDIAKVLRSGDDFDFYDNVAELGAENEGHGCREEDDSDEAFGEFLLQAYKDGESNIIYFEFSDGRILVGNMGDA